MTRRHVAHRCKPPRDTQPASALPGNRPCGATLNSLISGVSRISRNTFSHHPKLKCQASAEVTQFVKLTPSGTIPTRRRRPPRWRPPTIRSA